MSELQQLTQQLLNFRKERDWEQFHNPKDQILSLCLESAEVLELVQWRNGPDLQKYLSESKELLADELADVLGWVLLIAHDQQIDLRLAMENKILKNHAKYPVEKARGKADKYTRYQT